MIENEENNKLTIEFLEKIRMCMTNFFGLEVVINSNAKFNDLKVSQKGNQFHAIESLNKSESLIKKCTNAYCMCMVTSSDIAPNFNWAFCFGWAQYANKLGQRGIFSF